MQTASKPADIKRELLTDIAKEAHVGSWEDLRWYHVGGNKPRSIVVLKRGANKELVKTISANNNPDGWESWQPVLAELLAEKRKHGKKRMSHKKLQTGKL